MSGTPNIRVEYLKNYKKVIDANFDSIAKMEKKRKIIKFLYILCMSLWIILCIYWDIKTPSSRLHKSDHFIWIIGILGAGFIHSFITFPFEKEVKPLLDKISVSFFDNLKSKKITNYPDSQLFTKSGVVDYFNKAKYYEYFVGNYDNIDYEIIFAKLKHLPKDETSVKRKFKGFIIRLKPLPGVNFHAIISTKTLNDFSMNNKLKQLNLTNGAFDNDLAIYCENKEQAEKIISENLIQQIINIKEIFEADDITLAFYNNEVFISISTIEKLYKYQYISKNIGNIENYFPSFRKINSIFDLITTLNSNNQTEQL